MSAHSPSMVDSRPGWVVPRPSSGAWRPRSPDPGGSLYHAFSGSSKPASAQARIRGCVEALMGYTKVLGGERMSADTATVAPEASDPNLLRALSQYERPNLRKATWQLVNTLVPYVVLWALMAHLVRNGHPYWLTLALAVVAAGLLIRIFIVLSRLWARLLLCVPSREPDCGLYHGHPDLHALRGLASRPRGASRHDGGPGSPGQGRRMDADGQGVSGGAEAHAVGLPVHPESLRPVGAGSGRASR